MDRRNFLRLLGGTVAAAVAPTKAYSFLGGILRPKTPTMEDLVAPFWGPRFTIGYYPRGLVKPDLTIADWRYYNRITNLAPINTGGAK